MQIYYCENITSLKAVLSKIESEHCIKVLRHQIGDELNLMDGKGSFYKGILTKIDKKECIVEITETNTSENNHPRVHIAIAPTKNISRFEWFLEKATEIGVTEITPIICQRSERDKLKNERLEKIIISALKQSKNPFKPILNELIKLKEFIALDSKNSKFIAYCDGENQHLINQYKKGTDMTVLIGPEGD
ncbi:MAG: 16S rRNA (uracil(1498)-N(3))-methyltransferase, partial [Bacteroidetes bacterium]